ncbi:MAG: hypothetical protein JKY34_00760 [Kordiimonadaceae bacterium]|nr:hypothetical protein [Kordiimonadaceae bacterium]
MVDQFPISQVSKAALLMPFSNLLNIAKAFGLLFVSIFAGVIIMMGIMFLGVVDVQALKRLPELVSSGDYAAMTGLWPLALGYFLLIVVIIAGMVHVFNYWVRLAAFGVEGAKFSSFKKAAQAAFINTLKFLLIGLLIGLISTVLTFVLNTLGLVPSFGDQMQTAMEGDTVRLVKDTFLYSLSTSVISCFVYSLFSANLTQTAVGDDQEGLEHPHTVDFAVVLIILYAFVIIPTLIAAFLNSTVLLAIVQYGFGAYVLFTVPAAHGLRYRICVARNHEAFDDAV